MLLALNPAVAGESDDIKALRLVLAAKMPMAAEAVIKATPIPGIYEVLAGANIMYTTKDARYVLDGDLLDMVKRENLTENTRGIARTNALTQLGENNMLVYKPEGEVKHTITVFTDIDCPYCRRLHQEMDQYMAAGVKVRYIFVPFKGKQSFDTSVSVWCAKDRNMSMDKAKSGEDIETKTCDNPIDQHKQLATSLGIRGTPAIMLENGTLTPGYVPAAKMIEQMNALGL